MNAKHHKVASLTLVLALPDFIYEGEQIKGRLGNLYSRLQAEATTLLGYCPKLKKNGRERIQKAMQDFFQATGWMEKKMATRTYLSFLSLVISDYRWTRLEKILLDIVDHNENIMPESRRPMCDHAGLRAYEIWKGMKT